MYPIVTHIYVTVPLYAAVSLGTNSETYSLLRSPHYWLSPTSDLISEALLYLV